jgi:hypothetical protein
VTNPIHQHSIRYQRLKAQRGACTTTWPAGSPPRDDLSCRVHRCRKIARHAGACLCAHCWAIKREKEVVRG